MQRLSPWILAVVAGVNFALFTGVSNAAAQTQLAHQLQEINWESPATASETGVEEDLTPEKSLAANAALAVGAVDEEISSEAAEAFSFVALQSRPSFKVRSPPQVRPAAAVWGWCTQYVAAVLRLPSGYPDAKNWVNWLPGRGFRQSAMPVVGAVVVFQPGRHGVTDSRGHVGIVRAIQVVNGGWNVTIRGANQGGRQFTDGGFSNVSDILFSIPRGDAWVSFWIR